jgi:hypothetical protein
VKLVELTIPQLKASVLRLSLEQALIEQPRL